MELAKNLTKLCEEKNLSLAKLARLSGVKQPTLHGWATGRAVTEFKVKSKFAKDWSCSDFRHSFAVHFLTKGGSLNKLQYLLGHSNVYQTKQLYGAITKQVSDKNPKNLSDPYSATPS